jgi:hypothetical protein
VCEWGTTTPVAVLIPADLHHTGEAHVRVVGIDSCIAPIVRALQGAGINMRSSCCGHGKGPGEIVLADGRRLVLEGTAR